MTIKMKPLVNFQGPQYQDHQEMYEYGRLANYLIDGIANELKRQDFSDQEIKNFLASKWFRKALDNNEDIYRELGNTFGSILVRLSWGDIPKNLNDE